MKFESINNFNLFNINVKTIFQYYFHKDTIQNFNNLNMLKLRQMNILKKYNIRFMPFFLSNISI